MNNEPVLFEMIKASCRQQKIQFKLLRANKKVGEFILETNMKKLRLKNLQEKLQQDDGKIKEDTENLGK